MQYYDVFDAENSNFIMRAPLKIIGAFYKLHVEAEKRVIQSGPGTTTLYGNGKHKDIILIPVMYWTAPIHEYV